MERDALAGVFLQGRAIGGDGLFEPRSAALALAERGEHIAEIVLGHGPVERDALSGSFLEGLAIGGGGLIEPRGAALALAEGRERVAEIGRASCRERVCLVV